MTCAVESAVDQIKRLKKKHGDRILIPAHHYIAPELVEIADLVGDSYRLAVDVAKSDAEYVVFCGVRFMAEGAAILAKPDQKILHPEASAGCPMADMITAREAEEALTRIAGKTGKNPAPVVYMNSHGEAKALAGRHEGAVCTSSNAMKIVDHFLAQDRPVFFFPDYHLGRNIADTMNLPGEQIVKVSRDLSLEPEEVSGAKIFLWDGCCPVHQEFSVSDVEAARERVPGCRVIVHPESNRSVVRAADGHGSTQQILRQITAAPAGSRWAVGTEIRFVDRAAADHPNQIIEPLRRAPCGDMGLITVEAAAETMVAVDRALESGATVPGVVEVSSELRDEASAALNRMIRIVEE